MKKHLILGTAGHVDHGKTELIKALTGFDCDTHKQEKERGITINLGFSHLDLPNGNSIGIVDVPGHVDFIKTMVAGAAGIDLVLLIIAADEGVMPQTEEHLQIMQMLQIKYGLIVLTKIDLVDEELLALSKDEIKEFTSDTFLKNAPILEVSSRSKKGIPELITSIIELCEKVNVKDSAGIFRMYIDRFFSKKGFGTIVNGSVISGSISRKDNIYLLPAHKELRIRALQHHGEEVEKIFAGDRASLNITGAKHEEIQTGMALSDSLIQASDLIDVKVTIFADRHLGNWSNVIFLFGANRLFAKMHLLNKESLEKRQTSLAQIYLPQKIIVQFGDKFVIRNSSGDLTLGGGSVVDPYPLHHRRKRRKQIRIVEGIASGNLEEIIWAEVNKVNRAISHTEISQMINQTPQEIAEFIKKNAVRDIVVFWDENELVFLTEKLWKKYQQKILKQLAIHHQQNPLLENGLTSKEMKSFFSREKKKNAEIVLENILSELANHHKIEKIGESWKLAKHKIQIKAKLRSRLNEIETYFKQNGELAHSFQNIRKEFPKISENMLKQMLSYFFEQKILSVLEGKYFLSSFLKQAENVLRSYLDKHPEGIRLSEFRDLLSTNRTTAILLLEYFDGIGMTLRKDEFRVLKNK